MPRRQRKNASLPLPYRFSLPGGSELDALGTGFSLQRARGEGYATAAKLANQNVVADATKQQPWVLGDKKTGLLRALNAPQLFAAFPNEMVEVFTHENTPDNITPHEFARGHAWRKVLDIDKNQPLTGSFEDLGKYYVKLREDTFLSHRLESVDAPVEIKAAPNALTEYFRSPVKARRAHNYGSSYY